MFNGLDYLVGNKGLCYDYAKSTSVIIYAAILG